ncbi:hypothetical protein [Streptodolium elevatio]|uniref:Uncharacterized protein n=1 Tax=Streptodolium elevatio TaxID=3157996 RepID=A0ABV3DCW5_9ACTN
MRLSRTLLNCMCAQLVAPALLDEVTSAALTAVRAALEAEYLAGFRDGWSECLEEAGMAPVPSSVSWSAEVVPLPLHDAIPSARDMAARALGAEAGPQAVPGGRWRRTAVRRASEGTTPN